MAHTSIAINRIWYCHIWHFHSNMILLLPILTYADTKQSGLKLVTFRRMVLINWKKSHIHANYHFLFIRQWRTIYSHPQLNLLSHSIHTYLFKNVILLINIIVYGINIDGYDTIGYKHMFYLLCLRMNLGYGPSNYIYVQNEYYLFVYVLLYINNYT